MSREWLENLQVMLGLERHLQLNAIEVVCVYLHLINAVGKAIGKALWEKAI